MARFTRPATASERNLAAINSLYKAWNWGQIGNFLDLLHPDVEWSDGKSADAELKVGHEAVERDIRSMSGMLDVVYHVHKVTSLDGPLLAEGVVATGRAPELFFHVFDMRDGRVIRRRVFSSRQDAVDAAAFTELAGA